LSVGWISERSRRQIRSVSLAAIVGLSALLGCQTEEPPVPSSSSPERMPNQLISDFVLTETEEGRKLWVLQAERAKIFDSSNEIDLDTLIIDFFDELEAHTSTLTADRGIINRTTRNMEAFGDVVILSDDDLRLESEEVRWLNRSGQIISDAPVRFTRGANVLTGVGFVSDPSLENIEIREQIRVEVRDTDAFGEEE